MSRWLLLSLSVMILGAVVQLRTGTTETTAAPALETAATLP